MLWLRRLPHRENAHNLQPKCTNAVSFDLAGWIISCPASFPARCTNKHAVTSVWLNDSRYQSHCRTPYRVVLLPVERATLQIPSAGEIAGSQASFEKRARPHKYSGRVPNKLGGGSHYRSLLSRVYGYSSMRHGRYTVFPRYVVPLTVQRPQLQIMLTLNSANLRHR